MIYLIFLSVLFFFIIRKLYNIYIIYNNDDYYIPFKQNFNPDFKREKIKTNLYYERNYYNGLSLKIDGSIYDTYPILIKTKNNVLKTIYFKIGKYIHSYEYREVYLYSDEKCKKPYNINKIKSIYIDCFETN